MSTSNVASDLSNEVSFDIEVSAERQETRPRKLARWLDLSNVPPMYRSTVKEQLLEDLANDALVCGGFPLKDAASDDAIAARTAAAAAAKSGMPPPPRKRAAFADVQAAEGSTSMLDIGKLAYGEREFRNGRHPRVFQSPHRPPVTLEEVNDFVFRKLAVEIEWHEQRGCPTLYARLPLAAQGSGVATGYNVVFHREMDFDRLADEMLVLNGFPLEDAAQLASGVSKTVDAASANDDDSDLPTDQSGLSSIQILVYQERELRQRRVPKNFFDTPQDAPVTLHEVDDFILKKFGNPAQWTEQRKLNGERRLVTKLPLALKGDDAKEDFNVAFYFKGGAHQ